MARMQGNLALDNRGAAPARRQPPVHTRRVVTPLFPENGDPRTHVRTRAVRRHVSRSRIRACLITLLAVAVFFGVFFMLLYNQSRIMAAQFQNTQMEDQIRTLQQDRAMLEEEMMKNLDLGRIRLEAIDRLGMQETGRNKIVSVGAASADLVIVNSAGNVRSSRDESLRLEAILSNLEGFFKKLR